MYLAFSYPHVYKYYMHTYWNNLRSAPKITMTLIPNRLRQSPTYHVALKLAYLYQNHEFGNTQLAMHGDIPN